MDWLTRLVAEPQQTKQPQATTPAATEPAPEPPAANTPVATEPERPVAEVPVVEEVSEPVNEYPVTINDISWGEVNKQIEREEAAASEPVNEAATYDSAELSPPTYDMLATRLEAAMTELAGWREQGVAAATELGQLRAELAAIPLALRTPPKGYAWDGEPRRLTEGEWYLTHYASGSAPTNTLSHNIEIPLRKLPVADKTITLPADASDAEILAAFRAAAE